MLKYFLLGLALLPGIAFGQAANQVDFGWLTDLVTAVGDLVGLLIPVVIAIGLLFFIWGLVQYIAASGDEAAKEEGKRKMIWGIIALFIIVAVWGIVNLLGDIVGVGVDGTITTTPTVPGI